MPKICGSVYITAIDHSAVAVYCFGLVMRAPEMDKLQNASRDEAGKQKIIYDYWRAKRHEIFKDTAAEALSPPRPMGDIIAGQPTGSGMLIAHGYCSDKVGNIDYSEAAAGYQANGAQAGIQRFCGATPRKACRSEVSGSSTQGYDRAF